MTVKLENRKEEEKELHDKFRGDLEGESHYLANKKFYSISSSNRCFVEDWLKERCEGKKVLDYCCGSGEMAIFCAKAGADSCGIDISPVSIESAIKQANARGVDGKAKFRVMDGEAMEFPNDYFDFIVVHGVLHHLDLEKAYRELARILKPEGEIISTEALRHNIFIHLYRKMTPHLRTAWEVDHILGKKDIEKAREYFDSVEVVKFFYLATIGAIPFRNFSFFASIRRALEAVDSVLLRLPILKWQAWMAVFVLSHPKKASSKA